MGKTATMRMSDELAAELQLVARVKGVSGAEVVRVAVRRYVADVLRDPQAAARLAALHEADRQCVEQHEPPLR